MGQEKRYIAVDLGAESGRVMLGVVSDEKLVLEEVHRFRNVPIEEEGSLRWDFAMLLGEMKAGISKAVKEAKGKVAGIGIDTWGAGMGFIDSKGLLIEDPYHYRDGGTEGMIEKAFELMPKREIYEQTGIQFMQYNDLYRLLEMRLSGSETLVRAKHVIFMADLFSYHLCDEIYGEYTIVSTSQMVDMKNGRWSEKVFEKLDLPIEKMPKIVKAGTVVGRLTKETAAELGYEQIPVIAAGSHDTACAVAAVPAEGERWAYLSSGTWSLIGVEVPDAIINDMTFEYQFTNEGGVENTIRLLKNVMGLWLVQECKRQWGREGKKLSYGELAEMAAKAEVFAGHIDVDCPEFFAPGDMVTRINNYLKRTGQKTIDDKGQLIRVILESLAFKYRGVLDGIEEITGRPIEVLHIVGGGIKNELLCQFTSDATGRKVTAGPVEATASGNILMQAKATGLIESLAQIREIVRNSFKLKNYEPQNSQLWKEQYKKISET
ncbi:MAG: rhamnulokinase [Planctomycetota bacterium]